VLIPSILHELCADSEQLLSTQLLLSFQLTPDFRLLLSPGALSLARRSRGQLTRTYLTLFLAMFVTARAIMPFRPTVRRLPIFLRGPTASNYLSHQRIFRTPLRPMWPKETALRPNMNTVRTGTWGTLAESVLESEGIEREIMLNMFEVWDLVSMLRSF
jgi:hypothetical protein